LLNVYEVYAHIQYFGPILVICTVITNVDEKLKTACILRRDVICYITSIVHYTAVFSAAEKIRIVLW
jgi:hypothetical protein